MRILLLSNLLSTHTIRWAKALSKTHDILIFGFSLPTPELKKELDGINFISTGIKDSKPFRNYSLKKLSYFKAIPRIRKIIEKFKPDILHAHYASSYGLIGALSGFHPFIVSVWGSDVYDFPNRSFFHKILLKHNLRKADIILSTSNAMADQVSKFTPKDILVTPFGIDLKRFYKNRKIDKIINNEIVIGTVKTLDKIYGIDYLIRAFKILSDRNLNINLKLLIVGGGPIERELKKLTIDLKIDDRTIFTGNIPQDKVPEYLNMLDIYVALSISESFGVAIIEAGACELPVVVSRVGGLVEVVENGKTGYIVPPKDSLEAANAIEKLLVSEVTRDEFGKNARNRINELYNWDNNVGLMNSIYSSLMTKNKCKKH
jgi:glycosyltransferase involved in cell wall biosynthesis